MLTYLMLFTTMLLFMGSGALLILAGKLIHDLWCDVQDKSVILMDADGSPIYGVIIAITLIILVLKVVSVGLFTLGLYILTTL